MKLSEAIRKGAGLVDRQARGNYIRHLGGDSYEACAAGMAVVGAIGNAAQAYVRINVRSIRGILEDHHIECPTILPIPRPYDDQFTTTCGPVDYLVLCNDHLRESWEQIVERLEGMGW